MERTSERRRGSARPGRTPAGSVLRSLRCAPSSRGSSAVSSPPCSSPAGSPSSWPGSWPGPIRPSIGSTASPAPSFEALVSRADRRSHPSRRSQPIPSLGPAASATALPAPSTLPTPTPTPTPRTAVATRVVAPALGIDLPVVKAPSSETVPVLRRRRVPAGARPARTGRPDVPLRARARRDVPPDPRGVQGRRTAKSMLGMVVQVYTSDDMVFLYQIADVYRHQDSLDTVFNASPARTSSSRRRRGRHRGTPATPGS